MVWLCKSDALKSFATAATIGKRDRQGKGMASSILKGYDFDRYLFPGSLMAQAVRGVFSALNGSAPAPGDDNFPDWVLRNAIVGFTLGGYIESLPSSAALSHTKPETTLPQATPQATASALTHSASVICTQSMTS